MAELKITIGNKLAYQSEPFLPNRHFLSDFVGKETEQKLITAAWITGKHSMPLNPLLSGDPGVGKNRLIYELAQKTGRQLYIFQGHEDVTTEDMACSVRFSDQSNSVMDYVLSPLVTAMHNGGICFIDEIGKIRPRALSLLVSVLDERRYIDSTLLGERVFAHPNFRFVAATNTTDINFMPEFILSRMRPVVKIGYPSKNEIENILTRQFGKDGKEMEKLLTYFWVLWQQYGGKEHLLTPRDAIYLFGLASNLGAFESEDNSSSDAERKDKLIVTNSKGSITGINREHLKVAFERFFEYSHENISSKNEFTAKI
jgi:MoxR-like ATPase